jgi:hemolysin D
VNQSVKSEAFRPQPESPFAAHKADNKQPTGKARVKPLSMKRPKARRSDQEFLPAALEILETPPSPVRIALMLLICAFVAIALVWSWFGHIDIFATATGKIQPTGQIKVLQPLEPGRVKDILVKNGEHVKAGSIAIRLDTTELEADRLSLEASLASWQAEVLRRNVMIAFLDTRKPQDVVLGAYPASTASISIPWPPAIPAEIRAREDLILRNNLTQLAVTLHGLSAQKAQKQAEYQRLADTIAAQEALVASLQTRVNMRETLMQKDAGTKATFIEATVALQTQQTTLASQKGQLAEAQAALAVNDTESLKLWDGTLMDETQKVSEASRHVDEIQQQLAKVKAKLSHMVLASPIDGTIQNLSVTTLGQVVSSGQELMRIIPSGSQLEITAWLENKDIGFVHEGQDVTIKVESFPFTRYGTLPGKVLRVARDSVPAPDAQRTEGDPTLAPNAGSSLRPSQPTQNLVYAVTIVPDRTSIHADGADIALAPGMTVSAEIRTGTRRILEYVFSPLVEVGSTALTER